MTACLTLIEVYILLAGILTVNESLLLSVRCCGRLNVRFTIRVRIQLVLTRSGLATQAHLLLLS